MSGESNANTDSVLAAVASHGAEFAKICTLVVDLKKSMERRLDSIKACLSTLENEHRDAPDHLNVLVYTRVSNG